MAKLTPPKVPDGYDPADYPVFAVTVDVVILTIDAKRLKVVLVQRSEDPFKGAWALPGGFKRPDETLDDAAARELQEETGVIAPPHLRQLGAYGDPRRDPRGNVVTVAHLAVVADPGVLQAGTDAAAARLLAVDDVLTGRLPLAFDHRRILSDAVDRVRRDVETTDLATAFVGDAFTLSQLRNVFESVWGVQLDAGNFQRKVLRDGDWVRDIDGPLTKPGDKGGRPSRQFAATDAWEHGAPLRRPRPNPAAGHETEPGH